MHCIVCYSELLPDLSVVYLPRWNSVFLGRTDEDLKTACCLDLGIPVMRIAR